MLGELVLRGADDAAAMIEDDRAGTGRALVEGEDMLHDGGV
jgi:hypothetical protein